jgi:PAS domain S-box-containing protein
MPRKIYFKELKAQFARSHPIHTSVIYTAPDDEILSISAFIADAIENNEKCVFFFYDEISARIVSGISQYLPAVNKYVEKNQITFLQSMPPSPNKRFFFTEHLIQIIEQERENTAKESFSNMRIIMNMTESFKKLPGAEWLKSHEHTLEISTKNKGYDILCLYNENYFSPEVLVHAIYCHSHVIFNNMFCRNSNYIPPDELKANDENISPLKVFERMKTDIISRSKLEKELFNQHESLKASETKYRTLVENLNEGIWAIDKKGITTYVNQSMASIMGYYIPEMLGKPLYGFIPVNMLDVLQSRIADLKNGKKFQGEADMTRKDGTVFTAYIQIAPIFDQNNEYDGGLAAITDMTNRLETEKHLAESEARYRFFVENFNGIAYSGAIPFKAIFMHGDVEKISGYTEREFISGSISWDKLVDKDSDIFFSDIENIQTVPHYSVTREYQITRKDGTKKWVREYVKNFCDENNIPKFVHGVIYDVTEQRQGISQLLNLESELEKVTKFHPQGNKEFQHFYDQIKEVIQMFKKAHD